MEHIVRNDMITGARFSQMSLRWAFLYSASFHALLFLFIGLLSISAHANKPSERIIAIDFSLPTHERSALPTPQGQPVNQKHVTERRHRDPEQQQQPATRQVETESSPSPIESAQHEGSRDIVSLAAKEPAISGTGSGVGESSQTGQVPIGGPAARLGAYEPPRSGSHDGKSEAAAPALAYGREHFAFIHSAIVQRLSYPPVARRKGWCGTVKVSFVVSSDGTAHNIRVVESSGFELLDRNSLEAVKQASPFPKPPVAAEIVMPIAYRISDG
jgi:periplasmic protein TonB